MLDRKVLHRRKENYETITASAGAAVADKLQINLGVIVSSTDEIAS